VQSSSAIVQYHALGLLYLIRQGWTASEASFAHRLITSRATGWRWYDETRAADEIDDGNQYGQGYQTVQSSSAIVQYHALGLLYLIRQGDDESGKRTWGPPP
jgi:hypothetical protein